MIVGTTLLKIDGNPYFSPPFPRGGAAAIFGFDVTHLSTDGAVTFTVQHKNWADVSWTSLGSTSVSGVGITTYNATGIKEVVRIMVEFDGGDPEGTAAHFLIQAPSWRPN